MVVVTFRNSDNNYHFLKGDSLPYSSLLSDITQSKELQHVLHLTYCYDLSRILSLWVELCDLACQHTPTCSYDAERPNLFFLHFSLKRRQHNLNVFNGSLFDFFKTCI